MNVKEDIEILIEDLDEESITSILKKYDEIHNIKKSIIELEEMLKTKAKTYLKERQWERYMDNETKISVSITTQERKSVDMNQLKLTLQPDQLAQVMRTTTFEKMSIISPEDRKRLNKYGKPNKQNKRKKN